MFDFKKYVDSHTIRQLTQGKSGITKDEIKTQMYLANINTTFRYWYYYLHGSPKSVVENIVEKMLGETK